MFKNSYFYRTSPVAASDSCRFAPCKFTKKETSAKIFFSEFLRTSFDHDRTPPDDCFLRLSVKFEKFFRTPLLKSASGKILSKAFIYLKSLNLSEKKLFLMMLRDASLRKKLFHILLYVFCLHFIRAHHDYFLRGG